MIDLLGQLFARFDAPAAEHGIEKIKTIGDGYMLARGVPQPRSDHTRAVAKMALARRAAAAATAIAVGDPLRLRIGLHSGALIAGVIGTHKFVYDVWDDTVNTAKRMESLGLPDRIHVSVATRQVIGGIHFEPREPLAIKGKGSTE
jgi:adenylate cyclase